MASLKRIWGVGGGRFLLPSVAVWPLVGNIYAPGEELTQVTFRNWCSGWRQGCEGPILQATLCNGGGGECFKIPFTVLPIVFLSLPNVWHSVLPPFRHSILLLGIWSLDWVGCVRQLLLLLLLSFRRLSRLLPFITSVLPSFF